MRRIVIVLFSFYLTTIGVIPSYSDELTLKPEESQVLVRELLQLYPESLSNTEYIEKLHEWYDVFNKYNSKKLLNENEMKVYLLMVFSF